MKDSKPVVNDNGHICNWDKLKQAGILDKLLCRFNIHTFRLVFMRGDDPILGLSEPESFDYYVVCPHCNYKKAELL